MELKFIPLRIFSQDPTVLLSSPPEVKPTGFSWLLLTEQSSDLTWAWLPGCLCWEEHWTAEQSKLWMAECAFTTSKEAELLKYQEGCSGDHWWCVLCSPLFGSSFSWWHLCNFFYTPFNPSGILSALFLVLCLDGRAPFWQCSLRNTISSRWIESWWSLTMLLVRLPPGRELPTAGEFLPSSFALGSHHKLLTLALLFTTWVGR